MVRPEEIKRAHIAAARAGIAAIEAKQGRLPRETVVDGRRGAQEAQVRPGGVISYEISPVSEVLAETYSELVRRSPVRTGNYIRHILLFVNGKPATIPSDWSSVALKPGDNAFFLNSTPYARKIEGGERFIGSFGRTEDERRGGLSRQAPDGVFEVTAMQLSRRFGNLPVRLAFEYRIYNGADAYRPKRGEGGRMRYPSVTIEVLK